MHRPYLQTQIYGGQRRGVTSKELAEIRDLQAKVRRLEEDDDIRRWASIFAGNSTTRSMIVAFVEECRQVAHAVKSICWVLTE